MLLTEDSEDSAADPQAVSFSGGFEGSVNEAELVVVASAVQVFAAGVVADLQMMAADSMRAAAVTVHYCIVVKVRSVWALPMMDAK